MSTSVPDLQEELIDLIADINDLSSALVSFAPPLEPPKQTERVYGYNESGYTLGGGEQAREESFSLRLVVEVFSPGADARSASRRRWEIIDSIDSALTDDDFHGYYSYGFTLQAESELAAYDKGYLARSIVSIGAGEEV
jgi:hypothetical protein